MKYIIAILVVVAAVGGYMVFGPETEVPLQRAQVSAEVINVDPSETTKEAFEAECAGNGGEYREKIFYGVGPVPYAECGYNKASDGGRLCSSSDPSEKAADDCHACEFGAGYGPAAGDFGPMHGRCAEYETLYRLPIVEVDGTFGWQTYRNEQYGFEFKYPRDYVATAPSGPMSKANFSWKTSNGSKFDISIDPEAAGFCEETTAYKPDEQISVGGVPATLKSCISSDGTIFFNTYIRRTLFFLFFASGETPQIEADFKTVLSTFKFVP